MTNGSAERSNHDQTAQAAIEQYLPLLARLAAWEGFTGQSIPEQLHAIRDNLGAMAVALEAASAAARRAFDSVDDDSVLLATFIPGPPPENVRLTA